MIDGLMELLFKFVFTIIAKIYSIIMTPFLSAIFALFPDLRTVSAYVLNFFTETIFPFVSFLVSILHNVTGLPIDLVMFLFDFLLIKYSIYLIIVSIRFVENIYYKFKP